MYVLKNNQDEYLESLALGPGDHAGVLIYTFGTAVRSRAVRFYTRGDARKAAFLIQYNSVGADDFRVIKLVRRGRD